MTAVTLTSIWLNDAETPSDGVTVIGTALGDSPTIGGAVRTYAGGRQRAILTEGTTRSLSITLTLVDETTREWLESHAGRTIWVRDPFGLRRSGVYFGFDRTQQPFAALSDLTFKVLEVTYSDVV